MSWALPANTARSVAASTRSFFEASGVTQKGQISIYHRNIAQHSKGEEKNMKIGPNIDENMLLRKKLLLS